MMESGRGRGGWVGLNSAREVKNYKNRKEVGYVKPIWDLLTGVRSLPRGGEGQGPIFKRWLEQMVNHLVALSFLSKHLKGS